MNLRQVFWIPLAGVLLLAIIGFCLPTQEAEAATWSELESNDESYQLRWRSEPERIEFGEHFEVFVQVSRSDGEPMQASLRFDARMPEHGHGMNREPEIESQGPGEFRVSGLLFHMPGYWELYFDWTRAAITERAQVSVDVD
jgi:hypothetical protein